MFLGSPIHWFSAQNTKLSPVIWALCCAGLGAVLLKWVGRLSGHLSGFVGMSWGWEVVLSSAVSTFSRTMPGLQWSLRGYQVKDGWNLVVSRGC